jgi:hypothetical protein
MALTATVIAFAYALALWVTMQKIGIFLFL